VKTGLPKPCLSEALLEGSLSETTTCNRFFMKDSSSESLISQKPKHLKIILEENVS
jgi:hypothetical protein